MTIGVVGCGFWANYQVAAWRQAAPSARFAFCDRVRENAARMAERYPGSGVYDDLDKMLAAERLDLVDIITTPETHAPLTERVARQGIPVICQKPMAPNLTDAERMVAICAERGVPFFVHENFRWQMPIRHLRQRQESGLIGTPFRARLYFNSGFPVFVNQPNLATLDRFIVADLGVHLLDICRFLFGEAASIYCRTQRVNSSIRGEDVATMVLQMVSGLTCTVELSYASIVAYECFPQTLAEIEGDRGSISLQPDFRLAITTKAGTSIETLAVPAYPWAHPEYGVAQGAMVPLHEDFLAALRHEKTAETTGQDNLKTLRLMHAAYASAEQNQIVYLPKY